MGQFYSPPHTMGSVGPAGSTGAYSELFGRGRALPASLGYPRVTCAETASQTPPCRAQTSV